MKNTLLLISALALFDFAFAQTNWKNTPIESKKDRVLKEVGKEDAPVVPKSTNNILFTSDFSNASQWAFSTGIPGSAATWAIGTAGPAGQYAIAPIASTTAANGFALFDSDFWCTGNLINNLTTAAPINCASAGGVIVKFQQFYRRFADSTFVLVSTNNQTWTRFDVNTPLTNNQFSGSNPTQTEVNISSVAANQPTVWIRFQYYSPSSMGGQAGCGYAWMIDDVVVEEAPGNQINITDIAISPAKADNVFYGAIPCRQIDSLQFRMSILNFGTNVQNNVSTRVDVFGPNNSTMYTATNSRGSIVASGVDTANVGSWFVPSFFGNHSVQFSANSDSILGFTPRNTRTRSFTITDSTYAVDNASTTNLAAFGTASFTGAADDFRVASYYQILDSTQVKSGTVFLSRATRVGSAIQLNVLDIAAGTFLTDFPVLISSDLYTITVADSVAGVVTIPFPAVDPFGIPQNLGVGTGEYYLSASLYSNAGTNNISVLDDQSFSREWYASVVYIPADRWYSNGEAFFIRLNVVGGGGCFTTNTTSQPNALGLSHKLYPNPNNGFAAISYEIAQESNVVVVVRDLTGKVVMQLNQGNQLAGKHQVELNTQQLANGVYIYEMLAGNSRSVGKMIVAK